MIFPLLLVVAQLDGGVSAAALQQRAAREYKTKQFAAACSDYRTLTELDPKSGAHWADLGVCLEKLGHTDEAKAAELRAAQSDDDASRLNAYFNLGKLGSKIADLDDFKKCQSLPASLSGRAAVTACAYADNSESGTGMDIVHSGVVFCAAPSAALAFAASPMGAMGHGCVAIWTEDYRQDFCRPGDLGECSYGACTCDEAPNPQKCEAAAAECGKSSTEDKKNHCTVTYVDSAPLRIGLVCNGASAEAAADPTEPLSAKDVRPPLRHRRAAKK